MEHIQLPGRYHAVPGDLDRIGDAAAVIERCAIAEAGRGDLSATSLRSMWTMPGFDVARDVVFVLDEHRAMVGVEFIENLPPHVRNFSFGCVDPAHTGNGIGTQLVRWAKRQAESRIAKAPPDLQISQEIWCFAGHAPGEALLAGEDLEPVRTFQAMEVDFGTELESPEIPPGIEIRPFRVGVDDTAGALASDEAFADHYGHVPRPPDEVVERLRHWMTSDGADPTLWWLAWDGEVIAGHLFAWPTSDTNPSHGFVGSLGVRRPWRGHGLARALLLHSFGAFADRGKTGAGLSVDSSSLTGATRLYESVGMSVALAYTVHERTVRSGNDLVTRTLD